MLNKVPFLGFAEPISSLTHLVSALIIFILGLRMLWLARGNAKRLTSLTIYVFCCVFLFSMSGVYHLLNKGTSANYVLQILDHAGIYLMISGTFTPFQIILLRGVKRWAPLITIWILAITGLTLTSVFFSSMPEWLLLSFFISMGWMSLFTVWFIRNIDKEVVKYIFIGGLLYTIGAIADFARAPNLIPRILEAHEIFHIFVSSAALVHFYSIFRISTLPISDKPVVILKTYPDKVKAYIKSENAYFEAKTEDEVKSKISDWIEDNYISQYIPKRVTIKYFKEEYL